MSEIDAKLRRSLSRITKKKSDLSEAMKKLRTPEFMKKLGNEAAGMIRKRTRLGDGVKTHNATKKKLKPLSESYVEQRKKDKSEGELSEFTTPKKSNLTRTGQLIDSITAKEANSRTVTIGPSGQRDDGKTNQRVGEYVSAAGREFNNLSQVESKRISDMIRLEAKALIRKSLKK